MIIHVLSSVHQYSDSSKFPKRTVNVFSRYMSSSSSVNRFLNNGFIRQYLGFFITGLFLSKFIRFVT